MNLKCTHWVPTQESLELCGRPAIQFLEVSWPKHHFKALCKKHSEKYKNYEFFRNISPEEFVVGKIMMS